MKIKWYGHSCFELQSKDDVKVVTDPFDESVGYDVPKLYADIVTVSHGHNDHNNVSAISGDYELVNEAGIHEVKGMTIEGILTYHDDAMGSKRGKNMVFKYLIDGITICHLGDLGHFPKGEQLDKLSNIDVLLIPVGGTYTIDSAQSAELAKRLSPKVIIPMHYKTEKLKFNLEPVDNFIREYGDAYFTEDNVLNLEKENLDKDNRVIILKF